MKEFDYKLDYKKLNFRKPEIRKLYRIGRGEQGVLLVRPYTNIICRNWRFKTPQIAEKSAVSIYHMYRGFRALKDFIGMDMCRKFLEMGFTRARRYANHKDGKKYGKDGKVLPQEKDWATSEKAKAAKRFKDFRDLVTQDEFYISMRKEWRDKENVRRV
tara:strand:- start:47 stop:523 length:477 start_codon:yes stop_codon:yes gene_type:complete